MWCRVTACLVSNGTDGIAPLYLGRTFQEAELHPVCAVFGRARTASPRNIGKSFGKKCTL
jgi:hypothetical protein